jgi:hypothetical protein
MPKSKIELSKLEEMGRCGSGENTDLMIRGPLRKNPNCDAWRAKQSTLCCTDEKININLILDILQHLCNILRRNRHLPPVLRQSYLKIRCLLGPISVAAIPGRKRAA